MSLYTHIFHQIYHKKQEVSEGLSIKLKLKKAVKTNNEEAKFKNTVTASQFYQTAIAIIVNLFTSISYSKETTSFFYVGSGWAIAKAGVGDVPTMTSTVEDFQFVDGGTHLDRVMNLPTYLSSNQTDCLYIPGSSAEGASAGRDGNVTDWHLRFFNSMHPGGSFTFN